MAGMLHDWTNESFFHTKDNLLFLPCNMAELQNLCIGYVLLRRVWFSAVQFGIEYRSREVWV